MRGVGQGNRIAGNGLCMENGETGLRIEVLDGFLAILEHHVNAST